MDEEVNNGLTFKDILFIIKKHIIALVALVVVGAAIGFTYDKVQPKEYRAQATLLANINKETSTTSSDYVLANYLSDTFVELISQDKVAEDSVTAINTKYGEGYITKAQLVNGLSASCESLFINVKFTMKGQEDNPEYHINVVNEVVDVVYSISQEKREDNPEKGKYPLLFDNLSVFSKATKRAYVSHSLKNIALFAAVGLVIAVIYIVLRELLDNRFKSGEELENYLKVSILASIPEYTLENFENEESEAKAHE